MGRVPIVLVALITMGTAAHATNDDTHRQHILAAGRSMEDPKPSDLLSLQRRQFSGFRLRSTDNSTRFRTAAAS
jgi:hypothetical protein